VTKSRVFYLYIVLGALLILLAADWSELTRQLLHERDLLQAARVLIGALDAGSAVALAFLAAFAYWSAKRDDEWITITICYPDGHQEQIRDAFQREQCTRSEIAGVLRAFNNGNTYVINSLNQLENFNKKIKDVRDGRRRELIVELVEDDALRGLSSRAATLAPPTSALPPPARDPRPLAFWNLSNHPSASWTEAQRAAALALAPGAEVIDVTFPAVDPHLDTGALKAAAAEVVKGWGAPSEGERRVAAAMVAGEPLMCVELVEALEARGVRCYSATTLRVVEEVDGEKRSRFEFVRFRAWRA